jgi:SAM-dependent methyltransferase
LDGAAAGSHRLGLVTPPIFDRELHLSRAQRWRGKRPSVLATSLAMEVAERLSPINRVFDQVLIIAEDGDAVAQAIKASGKVLNIESRLPQAAEDLGLAPQSFAAIFHLLDLQCVNDVPGILAQCARALKPDGLLMACLFAGDSLTELRQSWLWAEERMTHGVSPRVAPMIGLRELGGLLQRAGLALPVVDSDRLTVRYATALALMQDIRLCGLSNMLRDRSRTPVSRSLASYAATYYHEKFSDADQRVRATIEVAWLAAWSPHESQQQPLRPGSAKARLADALKTEERKLKR